MIEVKSNLNKKGLKRTRARLAVLEIMQKCKPMSAQEIAREVGKEVADQATVYRIVQSFVEKGLLREVNLRHGHTDYELVESGDHHHLVCTGCGLVEDVAGCEVKNLVEQTLRRSSSFVNIAEHALEFFGTCRACAR